VTSDDPFEAARAAGSFQFDFETRNALHRLLNSRELVGELEASVAWHRYGAFWHSVSPYRPLGEVERSDLTTLERALERLIQSLGGLENNTLSRLGDDFEGGLLSRVDRRRTLADLGNPPSLPHGLTLKAWSDATRGLHALVRGLVKPQRPGRKAQVKRLALSIRVREIFERHRLRLSRNRDGIFAQTLVYVLDAAGERAPEDAFYLVKQVLDGAPPSRRRPKGEVRKKIRRRRSRQ
jgi:hypothetical protein